MGEEREINRKIQDEQMRLLEVERDTRLRQSTELRGELMKAVSKEREERMLERSEQRTEITKVMREWHLAKGSAGSGPLPIVGTRAAPVLVTPLTSSRSLKLRLSVTACGLSVMG